LSTACAKLISSSLEVVAMTASNQARHTGSIRITRGQFDHGMWARTELQYLIARALKLGISVNADTRPGVSTPRNWAGTGYTAKDARLS
jgi:hypothetical protein